MKLVSIGNGIYARFKPGDSVIERYWAKQQVCPHTTRDPRGQCYQCGHKEVTK